ncbi:MAG: hypothetical protein ACE5ID_05415 [Acidobacteriota bacterium]
MDLHELESKTVANLREMAVKYDDVQGASGMKKDKLIDLLCQKLGIDRHVHVPRGIGRREIKARIAGLRTKRLAALTSHDTTALAQVRREIKSCKRKLRRLVRQALRKTPPKARKPTA